LADVNVMITRMGLLELQYLLRHLNK